MKLIPQTVYTLTDKSNYEVIHNTTSGMGYYAFYEGNVNKEFNKYVLSKDELIELIEDCIENGVELLNDFNKKALDAHSNGKSIDYVLHKRTNKEQFINKLLKYAIKASNIQ